MLFALLFVILGFFLMEISGWFIHKYIMHGLLWRIHRTHHQRSKGAFELNDIFSLLFGSVSIILMVLGFEQLDYRFWMGLGITIYGAGYFVLHDVLIHRRGKWMKRPNRNSFFRGIFKAHQAHHANNKKKGTEAFGLLLVPLKYFKEGKK
ncbi:sterol desaturase family protein [Echinicola sp. CAU 1574]|uniref:Sterol desaturase family protein n=1 Tax=Echinicola arenosa TaxID=2774144 RepID=A0ABR9AIV0_9BACT|nr:sterol desaturase family protein [Echinicola arenosa]MBD8488692.1 sterol desaturase family protein [Echinicola arenosa]